MPSTQRITNVNHLFAFNIKIQRLTSSTHESTMSAMLGEIGLPWVTPTRLFTNNVQPK